MSTHDKEGREYVRLSSLKAGDKVVVDADFDCLEPWETYTVFDNFYGLYIMCKEGDHNLGSHTRPDHLIGIYPEGTKP